VAAPEYSPDEGSAVPRPGGGGGWAKIIKCTIIDSKVWALKNPRRGSSFSDEGASAHCAPHSPFVVPPRYRYRPYADLAEPFQKPTKSCIQRAVCRRRVGRVHIWQRAWQSFTVANYSFSFCFLGATTTIGSM
jgi:hypothetical protein